MGGLPNMRLTSTRVVAASSPPPTPSHAIPARRAPSWRLYELSCRGLTGVTRAYRRRCHATCASSDGTRALAIDPMHFDAGCGTVAGSARYISRLALSHQAESSGDYRTKSQGTKEKHMYCNESLHAFHRLQLTNGHHGLAASPEAHSTSTGGSVAARAALDAALAPTQDSRRCDAPRADSHTLALIAKKRAGPSWAAAPPPPLLSG